MHSQMLLGLCAAVAFFSASLGLPASASAEPYVWYGHWFSGQQCADGVCESNGFEDIPRFWVSGDGFTEDGEVYVGIFNLDGTPIQSRTITARYHSGFEEGSFGYKFSQIDCGDGAREYVENAFIQSLDLKTDEWSNWIFVNAKCAVL